MQVSVSELKLNVGKYIGLAEMQDIFITKNGKQVAKLSSTKQNKVETMKSLFGILKGQELTLEQIREERLARYENID